MPRPQSINVATVQFNHHPADKPYNLAIIADYAQQAADASVQILCFPEMCITGYWHVRNLTPAQIADLAEPVDLQNPAASGPSTLALLDLAKKHNMLIGAGLIEITPDNKLYNTFVVALPNGALHAHRKLHTFISPHMESGDRYTVFDLPTEIFNTPADNATASSKREHSGVKIGVLTCWDNNLVENARMMGLAGVDILLAPHQTGGCNTRSPHAMGTIDPALWHNRHNDPATIEAEIVGPKGRGWLMRWLPTRAHDNGFFLLFANGVGEDDGEVRTGNAMILDCYGRTVNETTSPENKMVTATLDLTLLENCTGRRWMKGRRPNLYDPIAQPTGNELDIRNVRFDPKPGTPSE